MIDQSLNMRCPGEGEGVCAIIQYMLFSLDWSRKKVYKPQILVNLASKEESGMWLVF